MAPRILLVIASAGVRDRGGSRARMRRNGWQQAVMLVLIAAVCVVSAGVGAGAEWQVYPGAGNADSG